MGYDNEHAAAVVLDCETFAIDGVAQYLDEPAAPANYKNADTIAAYIEDAKRKAVAKAALRPDLARIVALGWMREGRDTVPTVITCRDAAEEAYALERFWGDVTYTQGGQQIHRLITFNGHKFDLPMLLRRSLALRVPHPIVRIDRLSPHTDLLKKLTYDFAIEGYSLGFYLKRYEIESLGDDDAIDGAEIDALVRAGDWAAVARHCAADVYRTFALAEWMHEIEGLRPEAEIPI